MTQPALRTVDSSLPVIDIAGLRSNRLSDRQKVADNIRAACLENGFFYIAGHGIPAALIEGVLDQTRRFFHLPLIEKHAVSRDLSFCRRGYEPMGGQILEQGTLPDHKEAFDLGIELPCDDPRVIARKPDHGPNLWPGGLPKFRPTLEAYFSAVMELSRTLLESLALSLRLPESYFHDLCDDPVVILRLLHYPPQPPTSTPEQKGAGAHSDWGAITLLLQDDLGGLQVLADDGRWIDVPPVPGCYIVNLGDLMARWTNDLYRSTVHRVINRSGKDRYSVPFFLDGNPDYQVRCLPNCCSPDSPPKYAPTTVAAHTAEKYRLAFAKG